MLRDALAILIMTNTTNYGGSMVSVAINGFGRIGRSAFRVWLSRPDLQEKMAIVAVNTSGSMDIDGWAHVLKYDTNYGVLKNNFRIEELKKAKETTIEDPLMGYIHIDEKIVVPFFAQKDPEKIPWSEYKVDVVMECTGVFVDQAGASKHLKSGAKRVVISAPSKGEGVASCVMGVSNYDGSSPIVDNASCTTNCAAPVIKVLHERFGIVKAALNTIHAYTDDQNLQDGSHRDPRRARAAARSTVPTTTGAAVAVTKNIPDLKGKFDGVSIRVPVSTGSITDITCLVKRPVTVDEINQAFKDAANGELRNILAVTEDPIVSNDIIGRNESAIVDLELTQVIDGDLVKVLAWYDNEWGYCNRLLEQTIVVGSHS
jgi:glyceraldehyde-3-phosphate dehydrogenase type I